MKIDDSVVFHYLYGYQTMRLASQEEIRSCHTSDKENELQTDNSKSEKGKKTAKVKQEEIVLERKIKPPDGIALCISSIPGARFGACSLKNIPIGTWFGPFEGKLVRPDKTISGAVSEFMWEIFHDGEVSHFLDGQNQNTWMSFVKCARHKKEQNMVVFQYHGCIYYRTVREITPGSELLVWYDTKYTQVLGLPLTWNDSKSSAGKRKVPSHFNGDSIHKKRINEDHSSQEPVPRARGKLPGNIRKTMSENELVSRARHQSIADSSLVIPGNAKQIRHDVMYPHAIHDYPRGASSEVTQRSYHGRGFSEHHVLHDSKAYQQARLDKWREYQEHHHWQNAGHFVDQHHFRPHIDYHHHRHEAEMNECKSGMNVPTHPANMMSQAYHYNNYHHCNGTKPDESCRIRDVKPSCLPAV